MDIGSLLDPRAMAAAAQPNTDELRSRWDQYLSDPVTQGALLSFAGQAAQPRQWGQSGFGALMSSIGAGGQSVRQTEELERKQMEAESKADLREAQGILAESRAGTAAANANTAATRLELQRNALDAKERESRLGRQIQARRLWGEEVRKTQTANENRALMRQPLLPIPSFEEWAARDPGLMENLGMQPSAPQPRPDEMQVPTVTNPPPTTQSGDIPRPGQVVNGYRFRGGNPRDRNNWE